MGAGELRTVHQERADGSRISTLQETRGLGDEWDVQSIHWRTLPPCPTKRRMTIEARWISQN